MWFQLPRIFAYWHCSLSSNSPTKHWKNYMVTAKENSHFELLALTKTVQRTGISEDECSKEKSHSWLSILFKPSKHGGNIKLLRTPGQQRGLWNPFSFLCYIFSKADLPRQSISISGSTFFPSSSCPPCCSVVFSAFPPSWSIFSSLVAESSAPFCFFSSSFGGGGGSAFGFGFGLFKIV